MPTPSQLAEARYRSGLLLRKRAEAAARKLWRRIDSSALDRSWLAVQAPMLAVLTVAQEQAARDSDAYLAAVVAAEGVDGEPDGRVDPSAFTGTASDGRPLDTLLYEPVIAVKAAIGRGMSPAQGMSAGLMHMLMTVGTQVTDAGRVADGVALTAHRGVGGYVRMLSPPSCSRCVILAGKWFRWNQGFQRHPRCDCRHIPTSEDRAGDLLTDPKGYFRSLSEGEQNRIFTKAGAQAVRDGADLGQVVNARRGMYAAGGKRLTSEGTTRRGLAGVRLGAPKGGRSVRVMPEQIYLDAKSREDAIRLLRRFGYII